MVVVCHVDDGFAELVDILYSTVWLPGLVVIATVFTSIEVVVTVLEVGAALTSAPVPFAIALAVTVPDGVTGLLAPVMFAAGIVVGRVMLVVVVLAVVGLPVIVIVTTVPLVRCAAAAVSPAGRPETVKLAGVMVVA